MSDLSAELILDGERATLWFDRPDKHNALDLDTWRAIPDLIATAYQQGARVLVVRGKGGHFSAGADINALGLQLVDTHDPEGYRAANAAAEDALFHAPLVTIAAIEGNCIGGGCQIATSCNLRLATSSARFGITPAKLGLSYPADSIARTVALVGAGATRRLLLTADLIDAPEALRLGLVDSVVDETDFDTAVDDLVATVLRRSLVTQLAANAMINDLTLSGSISPATATYWEAVALGSSDISEGLAAFQERRHPEFRWRP